MPPLVRHEAQTQVEHSPTFRARGQSRGMNHELLDADLDEIEQRAARAFTVAPQPWNPWLETRHGTGGCSFLQCGGDSAQDTEMYFEVRLGAEQLVSPDARLDAIIDFIGNAAEDVPRLIAEIKRLRRRGD